MVVCNTSLVQLPTAYFPFLSGLCQMGSMPTLACNRRCPPPPILPAAQMGTAIAPVMAPVTTPMTAATAPMMAPVTTPMTAVTSTMMPSATMPMTAAATAPMMTAATTQLMAAATAPMMTVASPVMKRETAPVPSQTGLPANPVRCTTPRPYSPLTPPDSPPKDETTEDDPNTTDSTTCTSDTITDVPLTITSNAVTSASSSPSSSTTSLLNATANALLNIPTNVPLSNLPTNVPLRNLPTNVPLSNLPTNVPLSNLPTNVPLSNLPTNVPLSNLNLVPVTTNFVPFTNGIAPIVTYTQGFSSPAIVPYTPKLNNVTPRSMPSVQCNPVIYNTTSPLNGPGMMPCTRSMLNGHQLIQCVPGLCPITTQMLPSSLEVLPSSLEVVPSTPIFPAFSSSSLPSNLCASTAISSWKQSYGMEQVWQFEFKTLFTQYMPHTWMLFPVMAKPEGIWNANVDSAKVRFCCEDCGHGWTSMKGRVAFWFFLNRTTGEGAVCLKLYGQQCDRCKSGNYEQAMWYPEEILKVLVNIYNRVGQVYYDFQQAPCYRTRRAGKPRTPHNSELCQACKDGVCSERR